MALEPCREDSRRVSVGVSAFAFWIVSVGSGPGVRRRGSDGFLPD